MVNRHVFASLIFLASLLSVGADDSSPQWPQFRGKNSSGVVEGGLAPIEFGPGNGELWSVDVGPGHSSPCIAGSSLFLTTFDKDRSELGVVCLSTEDGATRWHKALSAPKLETGHPSFNPASSSPATDGQRVVAYFGSYGLVCFDFEGELLWEIRMPLTKSYAGNATSPAIVGDKVILYRGNHVDHFLLAVDKETGDEVWRVDQDEPFHSELACTACPIVDGEKLVVHSARSVQAFDLASGKQLWVLKCATTATSTPVIVGRKVIVNAWNKMGEPALRPEFPTFDQLAADNDRNGDGTIGRGELPKMMIFHRPDGAEAPQNGAPVTFRWVDRDKNGEIDRGEWEQKLEEIERFRKGYQTHGMLAIDLASEGVIDPESIETLEEQGIPEVPSPVAHGNLVYAVKNGGILTTVDLEQGGRVSRVRTKGTGTHYASPIIVGDKLYCTAGDGTISVLSLDRRPKVLAVNKMQDNVYATPAFADGKLFVRTHHRLYAFGL